MYTKGKIDRKRAERERERERNRLTDVENKIKMGKNV